MREKDSIYKRPRVGKNRHWHMAQTLVDRPCLVPFPIPKAVGPVREGTLIEASVRSPGCTSYHNPPISITTHLEPFIFCLSD